MANDCRQTTAKKFPPHDHSLYIVTQMRQTLFYIPSEVFGLPLLGGNGLLFWGLLLVAVLWFVWSFLKRGFNSDDISFVAVLALVAFVAAFFLPKIADETRGLPIRGYGVMLVLAFSSGACLLFYRGCKKHHMPTDMMFSLILWCVVSGLFGARAFHIIEYFPSYWNTSNPVGQMLLFTEGGLVVYGGIIGGMIATSIFFYRNRLSVLAMYDVMAPAVLLGIALGRLGCLMNGCCYGAVCDVSYGIVFPPEAPAYAAQVEENKTFVCDLKVVPLDSASSDNHVPINATRHASGCKGCGKREISKQELERLNALPAVIDAVKPGSDAEKVGLKSGMIVHRLVFYEKGNLLPRTILPPESKVSAPLVRNALYVLSLDYPGSEISLTVTQPGDSQTRDYRFAVSPPEVLPVYPTQIMSFIGAICLSLLVMFLERFNKRDGFACILFLFLYSTGRFCIEMFRDDEASYMGTGLSIAQNVSIFMFLLGIVIAITIFSRPPQHALDVRFPKTQEQPQTEQQPEPHGKSSKKRSGKK